MFHEFWNPEGIAYHDFFAYHVIRSLSNCKQYLIYLVAKVVYKGNLLKSLYITLLDALTDTLKNLLLAKR